MLRASLRHAYVAVKSKIVIRIVVRESSNSSVVCSRLCRRVRISRSDIIASCRCQGILLCLRLLCIQLLPELALPLRCLESFLARLSVSSRLTCAYRRAPAETSLVLGGTHLCCPRRC